ncbi:MAG: ABC transporter ATP-binding protein [Eubacteriales bacterium]|nr:ABC transporter ATP-binding protein [Eubacteriales bacterium]NCU25349.1 ABC transporter ATP-binding protein [Candidatus Nomurabacteria bacterium]
MSESVISLKDCWKIYRTGEIELTALREVYVEINKGDFAVIMGPSGSGKSTLMNIIGCLDRMDRGEYLLNGSNIRQMRPNDLALLRNQEIGFVFQSFNLLPKLDLIENVELPMIYAGIPRRERNERAMAALESVGLMPWIKHKPNEVSGGQKQRAAIARSIVMKPALLIADEPTGNLDTKSSKEIMDIFTELNRRGATIILITHEDDIAAYAKRIIRIVDGRITSDKAVG